MQRLFAPRMETRATEVSWDALKGGVDIGGTALVNPRMAENLSTVLACIGAISSAMASLPAYVYRRLDRGREIDERHPIARLIAVGPNQHQSWADFIEWTMASVLLRGNALAEIVATARGAVIELKPIPWEFCSIQLLGTGRLVYDIMETSPLYGASTGRPRRLLQDEVFHLRDRSDDGLLGRSRLQRAASVVQAGLSIQNYANSIYDNGAFPSGAIETDIKLQQPQREDLAKKFRENFQGAKQAAKVLVLDQALKWKSISMSPEDAEFLASRKFTVEELARLFGVPPTVIGDLSHSTFTNAETTLRWFAMATLAPWIRKVEAEFTRSVFSEASRLSHKLELDLSGLLRGDPAQRWQAWQIAVANGILDANEVREEEGFNPRAETPKTDATDPEARASQHDVAQAINILYQREIAGGLDKLLKRKTRVVCDKDGEPIGTEPVEELRA